MASIGMTRDRIAAALGINKSTLDKHFGEELARGHAAKLAAQLRQTALQNPAGVLFWLEQRTREADGDQQTGRH